VKLTIYKYISREIWPTYLVSLFVFISIVLATKLLTITEWMITHGVHPWQILKLVLYLSPNILLFALPAASLMSVLIAFLRLSGDNEIIALKSSGISLYQMLPPVLVVSFVGYLIASLIAIFAAPWGNGSFKDVIFRIAEAKADIGIKERVFCEPFDDVFFFVNSISSGKRIMKDVFVVDRRDQSITNTIIAREGRFLLHSGSRMITIHFMDGTIFMLEKNLASVRTVKFRSYDLNIGLDDIMPALSSKKKAPKEMFTQELIHNLKRTPKGEIKHNEMAIELMEKFSIPLAVFLMGVIGVPLGAQIRSGGRFIGIVMSLVIFLIYYMCLAGARSVGETGIVSPYMGTWVPDLFLVVCCIYLLRRVAKERSINFVERFLFWWKSREAVRYGMGHQRD